MKNCNFKPTKTGFEYTGELEEFIKEAEVNLFNLRINAKAIVLYTSTGKTASLLSRFKPNCPIIAITDSEQCYNYLSMEWNVLPVLAKIEGSNIFDLAVNVAKETRVAKEGDQIIVVTGTTDPLNNVMKVCDIK